ncbi:HAD hydrolase-like protein, partial [Saccharophagus degradans]
HVLYPHESDSGREAFKLAYSRHFTQAYVTPSAFFPRVMESLDALLEKGSKIAVATGKSRKGLIRVLSNLGLVDYFQASRCADETCSKPSP